jgi:hypothetical protein
MSRWKKKNNHHRPSGRFLFVVMGMKSIKRGLLTVGLRGKIFAMVNKFAREML